MVSNFFYLLISILIFSSTLMGGNILKKLYISNNQLVLEFTKTLKASEIRASAIKKKGNVRYIFDFKNSKLSKQAKSIKRVKGSIKSIRVGQFKPFIVRVVIDSQKSYKLKYKQKNSPKFYISLPSKTTLISENKRKFKPQAEKAEIETPKKLFSTIMYGMPTKKLTPTAVSSLKYNYTIMIDPGHGGHDSGAIGGRYKEKDIVLSIAKRVYRKLKTLGFNVKMTRYGNRFIKLSKRTQMANKINADLFVSIHANSISNRRRVNIAHGLETYFLDKARTARAKRIAAAENRSLLNNKDMATKNVLLNTVFVGPKVQLSHKLAIDVQKEILSSLKSSFNYVKDGGVRGAPFRVLVGAQMPAILIEVGYISNTKERTHLLSATYQDYIATGIVKGIINYFKNREKELE